MSSDHTQSLNLLQIHTTTITSERQYISSLFYILYQILSAREGSVNFWKHLQSICPTLDLQSICFCLEAPLQRLRTVTMQGLKNKEEGEQEKQKQRRLCFIISRSVLSSADLFYHHQICFIISRSVLSSADLFQTNFIIIWRPTDPTGIKVLLK